MSDMEKGAVKELVKQDFRKQTKLEESLTTYTIGSAEAFKSNKAYMIDLLVNGDPERAFRGGVIKPEEAEKIAAFVDWGQLVASSLRPGTERTWSNNWPAEPLIDQDLTFVSHKISLWELLLLWTLTIVTIYLSYEFLFKKEKDDKFEEPIQITSIFKSQKKLLKYIPIVAGLFVAQLIMGGYVITSYSIHYTKLYESSALSKIVRVASEIKCICRKNLYSD